MTVYTIGFTQKPARQFFQLLRQNDVRKVLDVRLNNSSQLAGFAKRADLAFFLKELCDAQYIHEPSLAPEPHLLKAYRNKEMTWIDYEKRFLDLMESRRIETAFSPTDINGGCLLCSEHLPHQCHRRLVVEYLNLHWQTPLKIHHLQ